MRAAPPALDPGLSGEGTFRRIGLSCLEQITSNVPAVLAGEVEGVHRMRVELRRLRAALSAFGPMLPQAERQWANQELRWVAGTLDGARDLDVFAETVLAPALRENAEGGIEALQAAVDSERRSAYAAAAAMLNSPRYAGMTEHLAHWCEGRSLAQNDAAPRLHRPIAELAPQLLDRRRRVVKRRSRGFAGLSGTERHKLRIALKKLRYTAELLTGVYDTDEIRRFTKPIKRLQDDLGAANDRRVAQGIVEGLTERYLNPAVAEAGERLFAGQAGTGGKAKLGKRLDRFLATEPFWH